MFNPNIIKDLKIILKFSKKDKKFSNYNKRVGILAEGKKAKFIDCEGYGPDAGLQDKGENTEVIRGKYYSNHK